MHQSYSNQQPSGSHTQNYNVGYHPESAINLSTAQVHSPANGGELQWKHYLTNIPPAVSRKLTTIGILYILIGILNIGLEFRLLHDYSFSYFVGFGNGSFLLAVGILTMILCRQQIYVLSNLFVVVYFQLLLTLATFGIYCLLFSILHSRPLDYLVSGSEAEIILIVDLIHCFVTFCLVIVNLVIISSARQPPITPVSTTYIVYTPQPQPMPTSFQNPCAITPNQSSSA